MKTKNKRRAFFANKLHKELFLLIFLSILLPSGIITVALYYLIFNIVASQFGIPEAIAYNLIPAANKVVFILLTVAPVSILAILVFAHRVTHKIVGPYERIIRELDECIDGKRKTHLVIRKADRFLPLVNSINKLLDKVKKG